MRTRWRLATVVGIELAAARAGMLPLPAIRDRLAASLPLPGSGPRDAPDRQRTLDGAVAWSYDLLAPMDQAVLRRLAVFDGGFDVEQATTVAAEPGDDLLEAGRRLFAAESRFVGAASRADNLPAATGMEIAFAGRSNVGNGHVYSFGPQNQEIPRAGFFLSVISQGKPMYDGRHRENHHAGRGGLLNHCQQD